MSAPLERVRPLFFCVFFIDVGDAWFYLFAHGFTDRELAIADQFIITSVIYTTYH